MYKKNILIFITLILDSIAFNVGAFELDESCVVNVLNRTVQVSSDGRWALPNVPSFLGRIRARVTCIKDGVTVSGITPYFSVETNKKTIAENFIFEEDDNVTDPVEITFVTDDDWYFYDKTPKQLSVVKKEDKYFYSELSAQEKSGLNYSSTNEKVVQVVDGKLMPLSSGSALVTARLDGSIAVKRIVVALTNLDTDGDGLPDEYEIKNGLNPNDAIDAFEDNDKDNLSNIEEYTLGTDINVADSDGDGITDFEEVNTGEDSFITDPLNADSDGDGLNDYVEILAGSSPNDAADTNFVAALDSINVTPSSVSLTFNAINNEESSQLTVKGVLIDGSELDLTSKSTGTTYSSSDLTVVSFGITDGEIFAGQPGTASVTVANNGHTAEVPVTVENFQPIALAALSIPGASNVDVSGDYAYVAAGANGLKVVDTTNKSQPRVVATLNTAGNAKDIKIVGNIAYIADGPSGLLLVDISNPLAPSLLSTYDTAGDAQDVKIDLQYAYIADGTSGIEIVDISDSLNPISVAVLNEIGNVKGVDVEGNLGVYVEGQAFGVMDLSDKANPLVLSTLNIGAVNDVAIRGNHAYVAAYSTGYRVINLDNPSAPVIVGGDRSFVPWDVALTNDSNFAFFADILFVNAVPFVNTSVPDEPVFQGIINFSSFGDFNGNGIALDASHVYVTYGQGLMIGQYMMLNDNAGIAPIVEIKTPQDREVVVEGSTVIVSVEAQDDVAVGAVNILVNDSVVFSDTTSPYQVPITIPAGITNMRLSATAVDLGNNVGVSDVLDIIVQPDADGDGLGDGEEADTYGTDPYDADSDDDGLNDGKEIALGTDPLLADTDGDGIDDKTEVDQETDPTNPDTTPPVVLTIDPADGVTDIPENTVIKIDFNEALRAKTVKAGNIILQQVGTTSAVAGSLKLQNANTQIVFTPTDLLKDYTDYILTIQNVRDEAGNIAATVTSGFTTGNLIDTTRPTVIATNPYANAGTVPVNSVISVELSEAIKPETVTANTFYLQDTFDGWKKVSGTISVSEDKRFLTFVPDVAMSVGRQYYLYVGGAIVDLFDNQIVASGRYFTTSFTEDSEAPNVAEISIVEGTVDVPLNARVIVNFDEPISSVNLSNVTLKVGVDPIAVTRTLNSNHRQLTIQPVSNLPANSDHILTINGIQDLSGNLLSTAVVRHFTTGSGVDTLNGSVAVFDPYHTATNVPLNAQIRIQLNERVEPTGVNGSSVRLYDQTVNQWDIAATRSLSADGKVITVLPDAPLAAGHRYYVYTSYYAYLTDLAGNRINAYNPYFTTGIGEDSSAPTVQSTSIVDGQLDIPTNARLQVRFNEPVQTSNLAGVQILQAGSPVPASVGVSASRLVVTLTPLAPLAPGSTYTLSISGVKDYAGNAQAGTVERTFTTAAGADTGNGSVVSIDPAHTMTGVALDKVITIELSERIDPLTVTENSVRFYDSTTGNWLNASRNVSADGITITLTPASPLQAGHRYYVYISYYEYLTDLAGNRINSYNPYFTAVN